MCLGKKKWKAQGKLNSSLQKKLNNTLQPPILSYQLFVGFQLAYLVFSWIHIYRAYRSGSTECFLLQTHSLGNNLPKRKCSAVLKLRILAGILYCNIYFLPSVFSSYLLLKTFLLSKILLLTCVYAAVHSYWEISYLETCKSLEKSKVNLQCFSVAQCQ